MFLSYAAGSEQHQLIARNQLFTLIWTLQQFESYKEMEGQNTLLNHWLKSIEDYTDSQMKLVEQEEKDYLRITYARSNYSQ